MSRHLRLMVVARVLSERRDDEMKYYRVNEETLADLSWTISAFLSCGAEPPPGGSVVTADPKLARERRDGQRE